MSLYNPKKLLVIAGPCMLETKAICLEVAETLKKLETEFPSIQFIFSGSFDKANRTSIESPRGPGLDKGLTYLNAVKEEYGFPVITDFHESWQAKELQTVCDALQIPAFLARQTDLLRAAAETKKVVKVKKGQFMAPGDMGFVVQKLQSFGSKEIWLTERGTTFGYHNLVVDMRSIPIMRETGCPIIFDSSHSVQLPNAAKGKSSGNREFIEPLSKAALAVGAQGLYIETHPNPAQALSDSASQLPLDQLRAFLKNCLHYCSLAR